MSNPIEERARALTDVALRALESVATHSDSDAARVTAATALLDRAYGKPTQAIIAIPQRTSASARLAALSDAELLQLIGEIRNARGGAHPSPEASGAGLETACDHPHLYRDQLLLESNNSEGGVTHVIQTPHPYFDSPPAPVSEFPFCDPLAE